MPGDGAALPEGGKANGSIYTTPAGAGAPLKCLYTCPRSMRNKRGELEA